MRKIYIVFGGKRYDERTAITVARAPQLGADSVWVYDDKWLIENAAGRTGFYNVNKWLWETERKFGFGWCSWKPYIILDAFSRLRPGDMVMYVDADTVPIADFSVLYRECAKKGLVLFNAQGWVNFRCTKRDCFIAMGCDSEKYWYGNHACGRFQVFQKGNFLAEQILAEWWAYSINPMCQEWNTSKYGVDQTLIDPVTGKEEKFYQHRTEQSVLSLLANKYNVQLYREACQFGWPYDEAFCKQRNIIGDLYPQLFEQLDAVGPREDVSGSRFRNVPHVA